MSQVVEVSHAEPWFLVHRDGLQPDVLMEFDTKIEAEEALCKAWSDRLAEHGPDPDILRITIFSASEMFGDSSLRRALGAWDAQVIELEADTANVMEEMFLGESPPILRPARGFAQ
jgi:hypothetical protein